MPSGGNNFNDFFPGILPTGEITTKIGLEKTFLFLVRGRGPNAAAPIAATLLIPALAVGGREQQA